MHSRTANLSHNFISDHMQPRLPTLAVTTKRPQLEVPRVVGTTGPKCSLLVYCSNPLQPVWRMSASPKCSLLYSGHGLMSRGWWLRTRIIPLSVYCYNLHWPMPTNPKRLSLPKIITTRFRARGLKGTQEERLTVWGRCARGWSKEISCTASE
jgi:hypothetical protein